MKHKNTIEHLAHARHCTGCFVSFSLRPDITFKSEQTRSQRSWDSRTAPSWVGAAETEPVCLAPTWGPHMPFQVHSLCMSVSGVVVDSTHFTLRTVLVWTIHYLGTFSCSLCHLQLLPKLPPPDFTTLDATKSKTFEFLNLPKRWKQ